MASISQQRKDSFIEYLSSSMSEYDFERGIGLNDDEQVLGYSTYDEFLQNQKAVVDLMNDQTLATYEFLKNHIVPTSSMMDKEYMFPSEIDGFCFDKNGKLVFLQER